MVSLFKHLIQWLDYQTSQRNAPPTERQEARITYYPSKEDQCD